ncbi:hypothetical protein [Burkholderia pseudomallei]|uniref:hypothetical protein n=1 Tax=Burkholderia pseudomallei TaxID=28450 RepID=UPI0011778E4F|nr:hypothetical protein [Burkholderia pseudomallei]
MRLKADITIWPLHSRIVYLLCKIKYKNNPFRFQAITEITKSVDATRRTRTLHDARSNSQHRRTPQSPPSHTRRPTRSRAAAIAAGTARRHATQETTP